MRPKTWFEEWFNEDYHLVYEHRNHFEALDIISLFEQTIGPLKNKKILDLCCGIGRLSFLLANQAKTVEAVDLSPFFINHCKIHNKNNNLTFSVMDMRNLHFANPFDIIFHIFTSFGYFSSLDENFSVFKQIDAVLDRDGYYFFDFFNANYLRNNFESVTESIRHHTKIIQERCIFENKIEKTITIDDNKSALRVYKESVMLIEKTQFESYFLNSNFRVLHCFGDYQGSGFNINTSKRLIYILQKK